MRRHRALAVIATCLILFASQAGGQQPVHRIGVLGVTENPGVTQSWLEGLRASDRVSLLARPERADPSACG
jgi:hypothetical protein